jgi:hypothetical protein
MTGERISEPTLRRDRWGVLHVQRVPQRDQKQVELDAHQLGELGQPVSRECRLTLHHLQDGRDRHLQRNRDSGVSRAALQIARMTAPWRTRTR